MSICIYASRATRIKLDFLILTRLATRMWGCKVGLRSGALLRLCFIGLVLRPLIRASGSCAPHFGLIAKGMYLHDEDTGLNK